MWNPKKPPSEKTVIIIFVFLFISALFLGTLQIKKSLSDPFQKKVAREKDKRNDLDLAGVNRLTDLQAKDTDKDGLNDFQELYNSRTSPYLKDSDSDGIDDKTEIDQGTDPNCPKGQDCGVPIIVANNLNSSTNSFTTAPTNTSNVNQATSILSGNVSPEDLRKILINSGAPENVVKNLNDQELEALYKEILSGQTNSNTSTTNQSLNKTPDISKITAADLEKMTSADLRRLMSQFDIPKETLDQVDDATLKAIFLDAISKK